ncbi:hypothetical protein PRIPAC_88235 [Pristionchus pacificus]|uniref:Lipase n=1 Tax=Pristionchus pacificus TaxID=54126 RepID=A0A2A6CVR8_PRIPA|nr:hypothetical protein PRIPAC_88235 [Pristionchus pacificus]|eukprot:PDM82190.1 lipase [Pristionchus pacificus]
MEVDGAEEKEKEGPLKTKKSKERALKKKKNSEKNKEKMAVAREDDGFNTKGEVRFEPKQKFKHKKVNRRLLARTSAKVMKKKRRKVMTKGYSGATTTEVSSHKERVMLTRLLTLSTLLSVCQSIIDPRSVLDSLPSYKNYTEMRKKYFEIIRDYPYGDADFRCAPMEPSPGGPKDVHHLRPSDIRVVAAIGDSLTAGREALTNATIDFGTEYRGIAFDAGADESLTTRTTIPNILSRFSSSIIGGSHGTRKGRIAIDRGDPSSDFNVAISGSFSSDLMDQKRLRASKAINFEEDWKLITIFAGSNDLCKYGIDNTTDYSPEAFVSRVNETLTFIKEKIPRSFINLMPPFNVFVLNGTHESAPFCEQFHHIACPSLFTLTPEEGSALFKGYTEGLADLPKQFNDEPFAVTVNGALNMQRLPQIWGTPHYALLAVDCFHFSGFTHDVAAKLVWQNLIKPENARGDANDFANLQLQTVGCPSEVCPYLYSTLTECASTQPAQLVLVDSHLVAGHNSKPAAVLAIFGVFLGCTVLAVGTVATIVRVRRRYNRRVSERTPLLTAHYYEIF